MAISRPRVTHIAIVACVAAACGGLLGSTFAQVFMGLSDAAENVGVPRALSFEGCNVLGLQVHGAIVSTRSQIPVADIIQVGDGYGTLLTPNYAISTNLADLLDWAAFDDNIRAVIIDIDSPGGTSASGDELARAIRRVGKPTVAVIHDLGLSSGYLVAAATNRIFAGTSSTVGSIGATYSYLNLSEKNKEEGIVYESLSSGPFKDMLSPDKPLTDAERTLVQRDLGVLHSEFVSSVAQYRSLSREHVERLADGSALLGGQALNEGLIDEIGGTTEASVYLGQVLGEPVSICWQ